MTTLRELVTKVSFDVKLSPLEGLQRTLDKVQGRLTLLAGAQVVRGLADLSSRFGGFALDLQNTAGALGITTTEFQKLGYAAEASGVSQDALAGTLQNLNKQLYEAKLGNEGVGLAFAQAGIRPEQLASFENAEQALYALGASLNHIKDPILRAAAAEKTLGAAGAALLPAFAKAQGGFAQLVGEADDAVAVLGPDKLEALALTEKSLRQIGKTLFTLAASFASMLAPSVQAAAENFGQLIRENKELINTSFEKWTYNVGYAMGFAYGVIKDTFGIFKALNETFPNAAENIGKFLLAWGGFKLVLAALSVPLLGFLNSIKSVVGIFTTLRSVGGIALDGFLAVAGLGQGALVGLALRLAVLTETVFPALSSACLAFGAALEATPVGWIATAIAALVVVTHDLWVLWNGGSFEDTWLGTAYYKIKDIVTWLGEATRLSKAFGWATDKAGDVLGKAFGNGTGSAGGDAGLAQAAFGPGGQALGQALGNASQLYSQPQSFGQFAAANAPPPGANAPNMSNNYSLNAPVTVNMPTGADPKAVGEAVKQGFNESLQSWLAQTQAATTPHAVR